MKVVDYGVDDYNEFADHLARFIVDNAYGMYGMELYTSMECGSYEAVYNLIREFQETSF